MNSLPKTVTRQRHDCDLNPGPSEPESSTLTTRLPATEPPSACLQQLNARANLCVILGFYIVGCVVLFSAVLRSSLLVNCMIDCDCCVCRQLINRDYHYYYY